MVCFELQAKWVEVLFPSLQWHFERLLKYYCIQETRSRYLNANLSDIRAQRGADHLLGCLSFYMNFNSRVIE